MRLQRKIAIEVVVVFGATFLTALFINAILMKALPNASNTPFVITLPTLLMSIVAILIGYPVGFHRRFLKTGEPTSAAAARIMSLAVLRDAVIMFLLSLLALGIISVAMYRNVPSGLSWLDVLIMLMALIPAWLMFKTGQRMRRRVSGTTQQSDQPDTRGATFSTAQVRLRLVPLFLSSMLGWLSICAGLHIGLFVSFSGTSIALILLGICFLALTPLAAERTARSFGILQR